MFITGGPGTKLCAGERGEVKDMCYRATHDARTEHSVPNKSVALSASACQVSKH